MPPFPLYQVVVLAIVQSLTEFLPISSTAHLALVPWLLGWDNPRLNSLDFDIALHVGTLAAVVVYFFRDWVANRRRTASGSELRARSARSARTSESAVAAGAGHASR